LLPAAQALTASLSAKATLVRSTRRQEASDTCGCWSTGNAAPETLYCHTHDHVRSDLFADGVAHAANGGENCNGPNAARAHLPMPSTDTSTTSPDEE
jgi:hypothetical protein